MTNTTPASSERIPEAQRGPGLLTPAARALIGTATSGTVTIVARDFQRWAAAVGDHNPLYFDVEAARAHGHRGLLMPPLFLSTRLGDVTRLDTLRPDGIPRSVDDDMPLPRRRMAGSEDWAFHHPVYAGDVIHWRKELVGLEEKEGRSGAFVVIRWVTTYSNADGVPVAVNTHSLLAL